MTRQARSEICGEALNWRGHAWLTLAARLYLAYVFLLACWFKIADPPAFALSVATYQFLPLSLINITALVMPWTELLAGAMLLLGLRVRAAALLVVAMMVVFMIALAWALHQGLDLSCGCFASSGDEDPISSMTMLRDAGWLALALYVLAIDRNPIGIDRLISRRG